jgi:hypothetical protein
MSGEGTRADVEEDVDAGGSGVGAGDGVEELRIEDVDAGGEGGSVVGRIDGVEEVGTEDVDAGGEGEEVRTIDDLRNLAPSSGVVGELGEVDRLVAEILKGSKLPSLQQIGSSVEFLAEKQGQLQIFKTRIAEADKRIGLEVNDAREECTREIQGSFLRLVTIGQRLRSCRDFSKVPSKRVSGWVNPIRKYEMPDFVAGEICVFESTDLEAFNEFQKRRENAFSVARDLFANLCVVNHCDKVFGKYRDQVEDIAVRGEEEYDSILSDLEQMEESRGNYYVAERSFDDDFEVKQIVGIMKQIGRLRKKLIDKKKNVRVTQKRETDIFIKTLKRSAAILLKESVDTPLGGNIAVALRLRSLSELSPYLL